MNSTAGAADIDSLMLSNVDDSMSPVAPTDQCSPEPVHDHPAEVALAPLDVDRLVLVQIELLDRMFELDPERHLPVRRDPVGAELAAQLTLAARLFSVERGGALEAEHPVVPPVDASRADPVPRRCGPSPPAPAAGLA